MSKITERNLRCRCVPINTQSRTAVISAFWLAAYDDATIHTHLRRTAKLMRISETKLAEIITSMDSDMIQTMFCGRLPNWTPEQSLHTVKRINHPKCEITITP